MSEHRLIVMKFGGSSVADEAKIRRVASIVQKRREEGYGVVVVVSAMGDTTSRLIRQAEEISRNPPRRELDMLVSAGERISMALLSMALHDMGIPAVSLTGSQSGIITNDQHFDARIIEVRPVRVEDEVRRGNVVIVAGYQGMSYKREITTLGRGGSDLTAVALAAALGAERCEIYSDVDGVYTADPRVVPGAEHLPFISYDQMLEMSYRGARVLHDKAVEYAREAGIALYAKAVNGGSSTVVRLDGPDPVPSLTFAHNEKLWMLRGPDITSILDTAGKQPRYLVSAGTDALCFFECEVPGSESAGSVSAIGAGVRARFSELYAVVSSITTPIAVELAPLSVTFYVSQEHTIPVLRALHG